MYVCVCIFDLVRDIYVYIYIYVIIIVVDQDYRKNLFYIMQEYTEV